MKSISNNILHLLRAVTKLARRRWSSPFGERSCRNMNRYCPDLSVQEWFDLLKSGMTRARHEVCWRGRDDAQPLYIRAIQGHASLSYINPNCKRVDVVLKNWTQYIYRVSRSEYLDQIVRNDLIEGGLQTGRGQACHFFSSRPMHGIPRQILTTTRVGGSAKTSSVSTSESISRCKCTYSTSHKGQVMGMTCFQTTSLCSFGDIPKECLQSVIKQE